MSRRRRVATITPTETQLEEVEGTLQTTDEENAMRVLRQLLSGVDSGSRTDKNLAYKAAKEILDRRLPKVSAIAIKSEIDVDMTEDVKEILREFINKADSER